MTPVHKRVRVVVQHMDHYPHYPETVRPQPYSVRLISTMWKDSMTSPSLMSL